MAFKFTSNMEMDGDGRKNITADDEKKNYYN